MTVKFKSIKVEKSNLEVARVKKQISRKESAWLTSDLTKKRKNGQENKDQEEALCSVPSRVLSGSEVIKATFTLLFPVSFSVWGWEGRFQGTWQSEGCLLAAFPYAPASSLCSPDGLGLVCQSLFIFPLCLEQRKCSTKRFLNLLYWSKSPWYFFFTENLMN